MKALFIRCNGKLTPDMLVGGLIDMGGAAGLSSNKIGGSRSFFRFIERSNLDAKVSAHYFVFRKRR